MEACSSSLLQKLGVKDGKNAAFLHLPAAIQSSCSAVPLGAHICHQLEQAHDLIFGFYESSRELKKELPQLKTALKPTGMIWVCWRRGEVNDLNRDLIWQLGEECGLHAISSTAIDAGWSAMKLMYPKAQRRQA